MVVVDFGGGGDGQGAKSSGRGVTALWKSQSQGTEIVRAGGERWL